MCIRDSITIAYHSNMNKHIETILVKHRFNYIEEIKVRQAKNAIFSYKIRVIP